MAPAEQTTQAVENAATRTAAGLAAIGFATTIGFATAAGLFTTTARLFASAAGLFASAAGFAAARFAAAMAAMEQAAQAAQQTTPRTAARLTAAATTTTTQQAKAGIRAASAAEHQGDAQRREGKTSDHGKLLKKRGGKHNAGSAEHSAETTVSRPVSLRPPAPCLPGRSLRRQVLSSTPFPGLHLSPNSV